MQLHKSETNHEVATIHVVDDEESARKSLSRLFRSHHYDVVTYSSARDLLDRLPDRKHGCLILDVQMPKMNGLELQEELARRDCQLPIIFLTARGDIPTSVRAIKHGAENYLSKLADEDELLDVIESALRVAAERQAMENAARAIAAKLTERERQVCECVIAGMLNKQIAGRLDVSERTVKAHRAQVMSKLEVGSVAELIRVAEQAGIQPKEVE